MIAARRLAPIVVASALLLATGCGGRDGATPEGTAASPALIARANATCRYFLHEIRVLGKGVLREIADIPRLTTERLVKPSIPLLERVARRQQAVARLAHDPQISLYADLFDPIIVLAQRRLRIGRAAERPGHAQDVLRGQEVERLMSDLGLEQRVAAREAGLSACNVDFEHVLLTSLS